MSRHSIVISESSTLNMQLGIINIRVKIYIIMIIISDNANSGKYALKRSGQSTPHESCFGNDFSPSMDIHYVRFVKYDINHYRAVPSTPSWLQSLFSKVPWLMVSKATDESSKTKSTQFLSSIARKISLLTRVRAVSVLWSGLYALWNFSNRSWFCKWEINFLETPFSTTFEMKVKFETGR